MIVKVQLSLSTTRAIRMALIYDKPKAVIFEAPVARFPGLAESIGDQQRAFFECDVVEHRDPGCVWESDAHRPACECGRELILGKRLPEQGW